VYRRRLDDRELSSLVVGGQAGKSAVAELVDQPQAFQRVRSPEASAPLLPSAIC
jgi:hypothetical protein